MRIEAQPPCASNPVANDYCGTATPICNLNGYCGNTSAAYGYTVSPTNPANENNTPLGNVFCANIQNNSWLKFIADSNVAQFSVWCNNCTINHGIQMQIYATTDCYNFTAVSNCWNPGSPTNGTINATGLTIGNTYYFMIDGNYGDVCDYVIACNVGVTTSPVVSLNQTICAGTSTTVAATGGLTYTWSSNPPDPSIAGQVNNAVLNVSPAVTTVYTVTVSNTGYNTFCTTDTTILNTTVSINNVGTQLLTTTPEYCGHHNGSISVAGTGGTGTYAYAWNTTPPQSTATVSGLGSGSYTVTVTSGGCHTSGVINVPLIPGPTVNVASTTHNFCGQNNGTATMQIQGGTAPFTSVWNTIPVQTGTSVQNLAGGVYTITVTDSANCVSQQSVTILDYPGPTVTFSPLASLCSNHSPVNLSGGSPGGGTYSGPGVAGNIFTPSTAGAGLHMITYTYTDTNNCTGTATQNIQVNSPTPVYFAPVMGVCVNSPPVLLNTAAPAGGTYFGQGVANGYFNPVVTGAGTFSLSYYYTDGNGCSSSAIQNVTVNTLPVVTINQFQGICINATPQVLTGGTPTGGTYSGTGVSGGLFNPAVSGIGTFTITYTYQDANGCTNSATDSITIYPVPTVSMTALGAICINVAPFQITVGTPAGGTYTGTGITANILDPMLAGLGTHQVIYTYSDIYGCGGADTQNVVINPVPVASFPALMDMCANDDSLVLSGGLPAGGSYVGSGVVGGSFFPTLTGPGTFMVGYMYADTTGCSDTAYQPVLVRALPQVQLSPFAPLCANDNSIDLITGGPAGGTYSGPGVSGTQFDPSVSGAGAIPVTYSYTDQFGCTNDTTQIITVNALPQNYAMTGGGSVCDNVGGLPIGMQGSQAGFEYTLILNGLIMGFPFTGTGNPFSFGDMENQGVYTIRAVDPVTGCSSFITDSIEIKFLFTPSVELGDTMYLCDLTEIVLNAGNFPDSAVYLWQDGSAANQFSVKEPGTYWVKVTQGICYGIDTVDVLDCSKLEYPNVFTPNGDLKNDRFLPRKMGEISEFKVMVFNRWGNLVYESDKVDEGWDGTLNNGGQECSEGVYYYVADYVAMIYPQASRQGKATGSVTLLR